ncbi:DinP Nucleotidyltransferase/DNA polymerase involved in DNA repair [Candidatus Planktophila versatilis]|jgi:DNA polymerase-4|uniref:DNA polymerase IV n=1 Tax=Candidatus Planktophila versatilis TaxID=1884905 RepID=A0AAD0E6W9_9ACTN|nr:DNA polymerase IV [Candidatus Planktophila versatilis]ASY18445.1 DNA polymerase IV [Candidatus Planktophila versatilis]ASY22466.1 DNA polymerase IV [Candidatus Planktophila versatilis]
MSEELVQATILHVDMDAFYASVAELDNPQYKGKALVVGAGVRGVVLSANYEARKFGIRAAMPVGRAKRMAPHAIFIAPEHHRYAEISERVMTIFNSFTPLVEPISLDEAFLDVTGSQKLFGDGREIAAKIRAQVEQEEGITCSVGIAQSKFIAKLASQHCKPNGMLEIKSDRILEFLHPLPVRALWGVGPKTAESLDRLGLHTVADIANTPRSTLVRALGDATGESLYELAWGRDYRNVIPDEPEKSIGNEETFARDIDSPEEILAEFLRMAEKATARLRERGLFAKTVTMKIKFADFTTLSRAKTLPIGIDGTHETYEIVKKLYLALNNEGARIRLVGVSLSNLLDEAPVQLELGARERGWRDADTAIDKAKARFGGGSVRPGRLITGDSGDSEA